jgi:histidinol-phosphate aminotransferase
VKTRIADLVRPDLADLKPYVVKDIPHRIKMDANENPFHMPDRIRELIAKEFREHPFNRYPDPAALTLRESLAAELKKPDKSGNYSDVNVSQLAIGNGSDELINYIIAAFGGWGARVIFPSPTFSMYGILAKLWGAEAVDVPLSHNFDIPPDEIISAAKTNDRNIVFISYPNNPTGNCFSHEAVLDIIQNSDAIVVIDEAYYEFSDKTFFPLLEHHENLILLRTFSKAFGLAGLRVGYMIAKSDIIHEIMKVKLVYNINSLSQKIALILLEHKGEVVPYIGKILQERERLARQLDDLDGIVPFPSDANFILFRAEPDAKLIFSELLRNGILIRNLNEPGPLRNCLRVTVGKSEENDAFLDTLRGFYE